MYEIVANYNFDEILQLDDVNLSMCNFYDTPYSIYNICCLIIIKNLCFKRLKKTWINNTILFNIKTRYNLHLLY